MKKIFTLFLLLTSINVYALSNAEVRDAIQQEIDSQTFPIKVDAQTEMTDMFLTIRGVTYEYKIGKLGDSLPSTRGLLSFIKRNSVNSYCNAPMFDWYKTNDVQMFYIYYDKSDSLIGMFKVDNDDCK